MDTLLLLHPDYRLLESRLSPVVQHDPKVRAKAIFLAASTWPDQIRSDARFYDESKPGGKHPPALPGFPGMGRHFTWHYVHLPFSWDQTPGRAQPAPNALTEIIRIQDELSGGGGSAKVAYDLSWLLHLVGDIHQPLHAGSRYSAIQPKGDSGGNLIWVSQTRTLHTVWDQGVGTDSSPRNVERLSRELACGGPDGSEIDPKGWLEEAFELDKQVAYAFGNLPGTKIAPLSLPPGYFQEVKNTSKSQIKKAGCALAEVLNQVLRGGDEIVNPNGKKLYRREKQ